MALERRVAKCPIVRVFGDQRIGTLPQVMSQAGAIRLIARHGTLDHGFNQTHALTDAAARLDDRGTKAAIPRRSASPMALVECADIPTAHRLHQVREAGLGRRRDQQPDLVVQQGVGMDQHLGVGRRFAQPGQVTHAISGNGKNHLTALSAMDDQVGLSGENNTAKSGHGGALQAGSNPKAHCRRTHAVRFEMRASHARFAGCVGSERIRCVATTGRCGGRIAHAHTPRWVHDDKSTFGPVSKL